ncbi:MAG: 5'/3'-nucleotidase SurE [Bacteroidales bacterium]|nr:5'/3'-nucleotidase SurE [Bacteroidales bacterium]
MATKNAKPLILITNDDGIQSPGIRTLIETMRESGKIIVVAPDTVQSGQSHSLTLEEPLKITYHSKKRDLEEYAINGTPVDCVKFAFHLMNRKKPDLLVSGINHGSNASSNVIYSGTVAAAVEGTLLGFPSVGFSLDDYSWNADMTPLKPWISKIVKHLLQHPLPKGICLNINFPKKQTEAIKGIRICRQAKGDWHEEFVEQTDPRGRKYYWITGVYNCLDDRPDTDVRAMEENYISITPVSTDWTAENMLNSFKDLTNV